MRLSFSLFAFTLIMFTSCQKEDEEEANQISAQALEDNAEFESTFNGIESVSVDVADKESDNANYEYKSCASISVVPNWLSGQWPKTITVDFGDTNCLGRDGNYRRGKIRVEITGRYRDSGTVITTSLENFYHNNNRVQGSKTKTNLGRNSNNNLNYDVKVENAHIDHVNGYSFGWNSNRNVEWIAGENTIFNFFDDQYLVSGSANGFTGEGKNYSLNITKNLEVQLNCKWIKSGTIAIKPENFNERTVDYGNGNCDRLATYTVNGKEYQFSMR